MIVDENGNPDNEVHLGVGGWFFVFLCAWALIHSCL
jgi:hypothetical protein